VASEQYAHNPLVRRSLVPSFRPTLKSSVYVAVVALSATAGFIEESPWPILLAALLALPVSMVALPCYYLGYGVLALVPGANPSSVSGSVVTSPDGTEISVMTGAPATWFTITTTCLGILALTVAAVLNVLILRALAARKRAVTRP
jgi:hypothetical protein